LAVRVLCAGERGSRGAEERKNGRTEERKYGGEAGYTEDGGVDEEVEKRVRAIAQRFGLEGRVLPIRSVGVQGDFRTYAHPAVLVGMTDWETLERASTAITNAVREVNRVVYRLAGGEWGSGGKSEGANRRRGEPVKILQFIVKRAFLTRDRLDLLREIDHRATTMLEHYGLMKQIAQMPVVLIPLSPDGVRESVVLRPVETSDFMTARFAMIPMEVAREIARAILELPEIDAVFYDVTHKPPGTTEWE
jgi:GMP synthase (glutamine-hydrolysing)